jgi:hypothetical protein
LLQGHSCDKKHLSSPRYQQEESFIRMALRSLKNVSPLRKVICLYSNIFIRNVINVHFLTYIFLYESSTLSIYKGNFSSSLWLSLWPKYKDYIALNIRNYLTHVYRNLPYPKIKTIVIRSWKITLPTWKATICICIKAITL